MSPLTPHTTTPLRVAVDATALLDRPTGVGVFTRELLSGLARSDQVDAQVFAVSWRGRRRLPSVVPHSLTVSGRPVPARLARAAWAHLDHPSSRWLAGGGHQVVHGPNFVVPPGGSGRKGRVAEVVTVHDLTAVRYPEMCTADVLQWPHLLERALRRGAWVHAVSGAVAGEVRDAFPAAAERVVAVPNGLRPLAEATAATSAAEGRRLAGGARYVLALGTVEPRKDLPTLVAAFDELAAADPDLRLVIAGPDGWGAERLTEARDRATHRRRIVRLGWVDDNQRAALLRGAAVVAYASRYEGFGLVPLEALAVGTPVVASAVGALPEVLGDAALLVAPADAPALADALHQVLTDDATRAGIVERGAARVAAHTWEAAVAGIVDLYGRAVSDR